MLATPSSHVILLPRPVSVRVIDAAVHYTIALLGENSPWPTRYIRQQQRNGHIEIGQNACYRPAKILVHPDGSLAFDPRRTYTRIAAAGHPDWPNVAHTCERHRHTPAAVILGEFAQKLNATLEVL